MQLGSAAEEMSTGETLVLVTLHGVGERESEVWDVQKARACVCT